jgi:hypothetical protein
VSQTIFKLDNIEFTDFTSPKDGEAFIQGRLSTFIFDQCNYLNIDMIGPIYSIDTVDLTLSTVTVRNF